jgi:DNA helicase-2/ATP-dependent DNA helicase PcrA
LTDSQRAAALHADGPLIVLAGPGTGKTRLITHRVGHLIESGVAPESIVALTFTVRAAEELRARLAELLGDSRADAVHAMTFHGLGQRVVGRFSDLLDIPREFTIMDAAQEKRLLRRLVLEHGLYPQHEAVGRESVLDRARATIGELAQNAITPGEAKQHALRWRERIEKGILDEELLPKSWKEKLSDARYKREQEFLLAAFESCVELYALAREESGRVGLLTYDDLILRPIELLRKSEAARAMLRSDYRHFVVDEFQDVNAAQIEMLRLLAPPKDHGDGGPDLCVVGDDDQAIYAFRGADERAFQRFAKIWSGGATYKLEENWRSAPAIVAASNAIIARAGERFAPDKKVHASANDPSRDTSASVEGVTLESHAQSGDTIAAMILADQHGAGRGVRAWRDYAVIAHAHGELDRVGDALRLEGIPFRRARRDSVLEDQGVKDLLHWMRLLARRDRYAALALLARPPMKIGFEWLRARLDEYQTDRARRGSEDSGDAWSLLAWFADRRRGDDAHGAAVRRFARTASQLREHVAERPADLAMAEIVRSAGIADAELLPAAERGARIANLARLMRFARERRKGMDEPGGIVEFLEYLDDLGDEIGAIDGDDRVNGDEGDAEAKPDAVTLVTAHSSKGLEFDTVFIVKVRPRGFPGVRREEPSLPDWITLDPEDTRSREARHNDEQRRLFYVAMTRAKRRLVLLAEQRRTKSTSTDYFNELTGAQPVLVTKNDAGDVLKQAARLGVKLASHAGLGETDGLGDRATAGERRRALLQNARREARWIAAGALDEADRSDVDPRTLATARERMEESAQRLAIIAGIEAEGREPKWIETASANVRAFSARLRETWDRAAGVDGPMFPPLKAPLKLSYSWIEEYRRCPRCFYFRRILGWPEDQGAEQIVGSIVHAVLEKFYDERRKAESDGGVAPGLDWMLSLTREEHFKRSVGAPDRGQLDRALAQVRTMHEKLFDASEEVEQIEFWIEFPYSHRGLHHFRAKLDRLDRLPGPDAGHRIVDYKTGKPTPALLAPESDDLQLGVYALALAHHQGAREGERARGTAEYWVLASGDRGTIDLADLKMGLVERTINTAIEGMLEGRFESKAEGFGKCSGLCRVSGG